MVFYRKDHLRALGWTEDEINDLARKVEEKEFLLADLQALAKGNAGRWFSGLSHRSPANFWSRLFSSLWLPLGGDYYDPETNKLVIDKAALEATLQFFADNVKDGLTPSGHDHLAVAGSPPSHCRRRYCRHADHWWNVVLGRVAA